MPYATFHFTSVGQAAGDSSGGVSSFYTAINLRSLDAFRHSVVLQVVWKRHFFLIWAHLPAYYLWSCWRDGPRWVCEVLGGGASKSCSLEVINWPIGLWRLASLLGVLTDYSFHDLVCCRFNAHACCPTCREVPRWLHLGQTYQITNEESF